MSPEVSGQPARGLLEYATEQKIFQIGKITVGGRPGAQPTVLIGTTFYHKHDVVTNADRGEINAAEAEKRIRVQEDFSERTGNPCMLDVVGASPEGIVRNLEFAAKTTEMPLLIDGTTAEVRIAGLKYVAKAGLADRIVYNSIQPEITSSEWAAIKDAGVTSAILLTYYLMDFTAKGRVQAVRELLPAPRRRVSRSCWSTRACSTWRRSAKRAARCTTSRTNSACRSGAASITPSPCGKA